MTSAAASRDETIDPRALREAAVWLMRLRDGEVPACEQARLAVWRARNPEHERAWLRAECLLGSMDRIAGNTSSDLVTRTLERANAPSRRDRREALKLLTLLLLAPPAVWSAFHFAPWRDAASTRHIAAVGEHRELILDDGSHVVLNTDSSIEMDASQRLIALHRGEILVTAGNDRAAQSQALGVSTAEGWLHARDTRFLVRQLDGISRVGVLEGEVQLQAGRNSAQRVIAAGEQADFSSVEVGPVRPLAPLADGWSRSILYADNQRLGDFLAELSRYRAGVLRCDPRIAGLRISGTFQLADTDKVLSLLARNHALRIDTRTRWWVTVHPA